MRGEIDTQAWIEASRHGDRIKLLAAIKNIHRATIDLPSSRVAACSGPVLAPGDGLYDPSRGSLMLQTVNSDPSQAPSGATQILTHDLAPPRGTAAWRRQ